MTLIIEFIKQNWGMLLIALLAFIEVIVRLTPTEKDNTIFAIVKRIINLFIPNRKKTGGFFK